MNQYTIEIQSRTKQLAVDIINLIKVITIDTLNKNIISQLLRSSTSIGANYFEALECESRDDFIHKLSIAKKEANETLYWLYLLANTDTKIANQITRIDQETTELMKIFASSIATTKRNKQNHQ